jgi:four helix bundle protein
MGQLDKKYDLKERTSKYGVTIVKFCKSISQDAISKPLISQIVRSATSIGANYMEASNASSKKDFGNKIYICKKEAEETKHWIQMISVCCEDRKEELRKLWKEAQELTMIFQKIVSSLKN